MSINTLKYIEEYIKIKDKNSRVIPFKLNYPQMKLYNIIKQQHKEHKPVRVIILKARQMGFSTLTESIIFKNTTTKHNVNSGIITHQDVATNNLFNMSKLMYNNLPDEMKPSIKNSNAKELIFDTANGNGLGSKIKCMTAGSKGVGRSDTLNNLHISELAFWEGNKKETLNGLMQAVPNNPNSMIIIESTANGYDYFKELWDKAVAKENDYIPLFVGWNELTEYQMPYNGFELTEEERTLKDIYKLTNEQITWRRWCIKNNCGGDKEQFQQEYPINPQEAFLSTGECIFDKEKIANRLHVIPKPLKVGYFLYDYDDTLPARGKRNNFGELYTKNKISNIRWVNDENGSIQIFKTLNQLIDTKFAIGGDTAGEGSDWFTGHVLDVKTGEQVAKLRHQTDSDLYTRQIYCLGLFYKEALIGIESNFDSFPIRELERLGYKNQYVREKTDEYTKKKEKKFGFRTTTITRPLILSNLVKIVREEINTINDNNTLMEMLTFIKNEKGRAEAQQGAHDDDVMGLAIAHEIRTQVIISQKIIEIQNEHKFSSGKRREKTNMDYGSTITVI